MFILSALSSIGIALMRDTLSPAIINALFEKAEYVKAHASALSLFLQKPDDYDNGLLFLRTAIFIERVDGVIATLQDVASRMPSSQFHLLMFQAQLCTGNCAAAWEHLHQAGLAQSSLAFHDCAFRIDYRDYNLTAAMAHLEAMEKLADRSLTHVFKKFEILKLQGQYSHIQQIITALQDDNPRMDRFALAQLQLWQAGVAHDQYQFDASLAITETLISELILELKTHPVTEKSSNAPLAQKSWTRRRQHHIIKDLERIILQHDLPIFMVAGSLLSLVRDGDFFLSDKDMDVGVLGADFERTTQLLIDSRYFDDVSPAQYFVGYKQLRHRATGFIVDVTHYQVHSEKIHAIWEHVSGEVLRQTSFPLFELKEAFFPSLACRVLIPDQPEIYLTSLYGDWRTPNPHFNTVVAACNLCKITPFLLSLSFIKIADDLLNNRFLKAKASVKHLHDQSFQSPLLTHIYDLL